MGDFLCSLVEWLVCFSPFLIFVFVMRSDGSPVEIGVLVATLAVAFALVMVSM